MLISYGILLAVACTAFFLLHDFITFICVMLVVILPICTYFIALYTAHGIKITLSPLYYIVVTNNPAVLKLTLQNKTIFPVSCVSITLTSRNSFTIEGVKDSVNDIFAPISIKGNVEVNAVIISPHCGNITVEVSRVRVYDFFHLTYVTLRMDSNVATITNLPIMQKVEDALAIELSDTENSNTYSEYKSGDDHAQVFDYHEYGQGDKLKNINWKLSSRMETIMVKEFSLPINTSTLVLPELNAACHDDVDKVMSTLCWVTHWLLDNRFTHTIRWFKDADLAQCNQYIDPACDDAGTLLTVFEQLYTGFVYNENFLLDSYSYQSSFSNVIYITCTIASDLLERLYTVGLQANLTLVCCQGGETQKLELLRSEIETHGIKLLIL